ncbi:hypothetical protein C8T65DRAFT_665879 [Cerioporus squamosus]|nr:hypothetical protein C8T65DRAFT_665879 [Cerioporus squamosus]
MPWAAHAPRMLSVGCRTQITAERVMYFQRQLENIDNASLMQLEPKFGTYPSADGKRLQVELWYTANFVLDTDGWDVVPKKGRVYKLAVDTGDCCFWFLEKDFQQLQRVEIPPSERMMGGEKFRYTTRDWSDTPLNFQQRCRRRGVIPPSTAPIAESCMMRYGDGGELRLKRWPSSPDVDLQFKAPIWDWVNGQSAYSPNHRIQFTRILADAVNPTTAGQGIDGNLGMGVPGWRTPWRFAESKDKATFFNIINHGPGTVQTPMCVTVRLLPPDGYQLARASQRVQSFLYFGVGSPCGIHLDWRPIEDIIRIPEYTPQLYIYPDLGDPDEFHWWSLQLLSITLLEPMVDYPNYGVIDELNWMPKQIPLGAVNQDGSSTGIRVIFDSGSLCSILPRDVLQAIWTHWFHHEAHLYPNEASFLIHSRDFSRHDILFHFKDVYGTTVHFRCRAQEFLGSPWSDGRGGWGACFAEAKGNAGLGREPYILGANFFWASILRLDATYRGDRPVPGQAKPFMQFAPQRILSDGVSIAGPWDLEIHADLPPEMQAVLRGQPELRA